MDIFRHLRIAWIALLVLVVARLPASDTSFMAHLGFSEDGRYLACERYGIQEAGPTCYSEIFVIDVVENRFAGTPVRVLRENTENVSLDSVRREARRAAGDFLAQYGIVNGNQGDLVLYHPITDLTYQPDLRQNMTPTDQTVRFLRRQHFLHVYGEEFELHLRHLPLDRLCPLSERPAQIFELRLSHNKQEKILQKDARLPESRGCVLCYRIERVYLYENHIAVFLNLWRLGFEGADIRHLVVTGTLVF